MMYWKLSRIFLFRCSQNVFSRIFYKVVLLMGVPKPGGDGRYIPPNNLSVVYICILPNNLTLVCIWAQVSTWIREKKCSFFGEDLLFSFFFVFTWIRGKSVPSLVKTFFGLHLICSPEKNRGRGLSPPMLKIGQNWGKIANYPPPVLNKDRHPCLLWSNHDKHLYSFFLEC